MSNDETALYGYENFPAWLQGAVSGWAISHLSDMPVLNHSAKLDPTGNVAYVNYHVIGGAPIRVKLTRIS